MEILNRNFYLRADVCQISRELLGKFLFTKINGKLTVGIITETEAYAGITDRASHAFGERRTKRNEMMYSEGGVAYIYFCYGMHYLFNVVTNYKDIPHAVLVRAIIPVKGIAMMSKRRNKKPAKYDFTDGPAKVTQALGITTKYNGADLAGKTIWIEDRSIRIKDKDIVVSPRIGVAYAGKDSLLPYRFFVTDLLIK